MTQYSPKSYFTAGSHGQDPVPLFRRSILLLILIVTIGATGFHYLENWPWLDALYFTVVFLATIGLGDIHPVTLPGKLFAIFIAAIGVGLVAYSIAQFASMMVGREFQRLMGRRKVEKAIKNLRNHYIICGYGLTGTFICDELAGGKVDFIVIEKEPTIIERLQQHREKYLHIQGDATEEQTLLEAGVQRARGLVTVTRNDAENVYITLTAKDLNPQLHVISLATDERSSEKLRRAGCDLVVSPQEIGGRRIVHGILRPSVMDFIDLAVYDPNLELQMEQIVVHQKSRLADSTLVAQNIRKNFNVIILGIKTQEGKMIFNPDPHYSLKVGDTLIALGKYADMQRMAQSIG